MSILDRIRTGDQLDAMEFPPLSWAVHGLIPEGFGLLTGAPKAGKSWCVLEIGLAVASGTNALGKVPTGRERPVLYFALEDGDRRLQGRARHLLGEGVPIPPHLHYLTEGTPAEVMAAIPEWLDIYGRTNPLVILDTLGKVMPAALPGEGAYQRDYRVGSRFKELVKQHPGATILVVHHVRKAGSDDWMDSTSGTNGLNGAADFTLNLSRSRNEEAGVLRVTGRDVPESEYAITNTSGRWTIDGTALVEAAEKARHLRAVENLDQRSADIVELVGQNPEGITTAAVAESLGITSSAASTYLGRLADAGRIARKSRGLYIPPVGSVGSVGKDGLDTSDPTLPTHTTPPCSACGFPLDPSVVAEGFTTHPAC
ncbi:AAA family ATPase [Ornithinimicrobium sp. Y1694]|uniref:AAA family ATPase n=1 Tax=Ornithinimicrobium sp. Y1694 TaxID=3418590 RepID=UPI003CEDBA30